MPESLLIEKIVACHTSEMGLIFKIDIEIIQISNNRTTQSYTGGKI